MFKKSSPAVRLIFAIGLSMIAVLIVVPTMQRAQQRLPHHDLGHHDPVPLRLRYNWNGETQAKVKPVPPDDQKTDSPLPEPTTFSVSTHWPASSRESDERVPLVALDRSPRLFRGPPASRLS